MNILQINFNSAYQRPQNRVNTALRLNNQLQSDTVSFTRKSTIEKSRDTLGKLFPKHKGIVYKKVKDENGNITKVPVEVDIVKSNDDTFEFMLDRESLGYVSLTYISKKDCIKEIKNYDGSDLLHKNYKLYGINGDRIVVDYLLNESGGEYTGIGHLADLLEVAVCKELGIKPNILSISTKKAAPFHYKRGKRFIPYVQYCDKGLMRMHKLYGKYPNELVEEIVKNTPEGKKYDTSSLKVSPLMYMPKEMVKELETELEEHPIF